MARAKGFRLVKGAPQDLIPREVAYPSPDDPRPEPFGVCVYVKGEGKPAGGVPLGEALPAARDACRIPRVVRAEVFRRGQLLAAWGWLPGHRIPRWGRLTPPLAGGFSPK